MTEPGHTCRYCSTPIPARKTLCGSEECLLAHRRAAGQRWKHSMPDVRTERTRRRQGTRRPGNQD